MCPIKKEPSPNKNKFLLVAPSEMANITSPIRHMTNAGNILKYKTVSPELITPEVATAINNKLLVNFTNV